MQVAWPGASPSSKLVQNSGLIVLSITLPVLTWWPGPLYTWRKGWGWGWG